MELSRKLFWPCCSSSCSWWPQVGPVTVAEARTCESQSHKFRGPCVRRANCANVCRTEGFQGGKCRGFRRRCFCTTHCH
ncbi:hypothetical protein ACP70R_016879 [Stipagrostis hirtigluma subsp. patula]